MKNQTEVQNRSIIEFDDWSLTHLELSFGTSVFYPLKLHPKPHDDSINADGF